MRSHPTRDTPDSKQPQSLEYHDDVLFLRAVLQRGETALLRKRSHFHPTQSLREAEEWGDRSASATHEDRPPTGKIFIDFLAIGEIRARLGHAQENVIAAYRRVQEASSQRTELLAADVYHVGEGPGSACLYAGRSIDGFGAVAVLSPYIDRAKDKAVIAAFRLGQHDESRR